MWMIFSCFSFLKNCKFSFIVEFKLILLLLNHLTNLFIYQITAHGTYTQKKRAKGNKCYFYYFTYFRNAENANILLAVMKQTL